jgi:hypothetical protein
LFSFILFIVVGTTDIRVGRASRGLWLLRQWATIESVFENRFETFIGTGPQCERPLAGRFQALVPIAFPEAHDP